jgi:hypothetical protein
MEARALFGTAGFGPVDFPVRPSRWCQCPLAGRPPLIAALTEAAEAAWTTDTLAGLAAAGPAGPSTTLDDGTDLFIGNVSFAVDGRTPPTCRICWRWSTHSRLKSLRLYLIHKPFERHTDIVGQRAGEPAAATAAATLAPPVSLLPEFSTWSCTSRAVVPTRPTSPRGSASPTASARRVTPKSEKWWRKKSIHINHGKYHDLTDAYHLSYRDCTGPPARI